MKTMHYYVVDVFTDEIFKGNPAAVCPLKESISEELMQKIAFENNLPETAFFYEDGERYRLRWFTPEFEIDLCGHGTLAAAYVIFSYIRPELQQIQFKTKSGILTVTKKGELYEMIFPKRPLRRIAPTPEIKDAFADESWEIWEDRDLYIVMNSEEEVRAFIPDYDKLLKLDRWLGVVITAKGEEADFVSRYFCPEIKAEDPVTGSSHSSLIPLWGEKIGKEKMLAKQLSLRGGTLYCELGVDNVKISGKAVLYAEGEIFCTEGV